MRTASYRPGAVLALVLFCVYGGLAVSVDFPRAAIGFQSDEATYYMMGYSLALDGDLTYRREDLMRVWREFPSGPSGVFLKRGRDVTDWGFMRRPPFFWTTSVPDPDTSRATIYGKSFIYSAFAAPFVRVFGTNGFLVFHALLLALVAWCSYVFLLARMPASLAATLTGGFLMASVVPVYFVWITPELFIFSLGLLAYFCWLYKQVATREQAPLRACAGCSAREERRRGRRRFSGWPPSRRSPTRCCFLRSSPGRSGGAQWRQAILSTVAFSVVTVGLFGINTAISGEWNYQGGEDRSTFYHEFPLQTPESGFGVGAAKETQRGADRHHLRPAGLRHQPRAQPRLLLRRPLLRACCRTSFRRLFALAAFVVALRRRPAWQYFVVAAVLGQMLIFIVGTPYTWHGGGGSVGNRYFMSAYGLLLFVMPVAAAPVDGVRALGGWRALHRAARAQSVLRLVLSWQLREARAAALAAGRADAGLRLADQHRQLARPRLVRRPSEGRKGPGFQIYFFDDNALSAGRGQDLLGEG